MAVIGIHVSMLSKTSQDPFVEGLSMVFSYLTQVFNKIVLYTIVKHIVTEVLSNSVIN